MSTFNLKIYKGNAEKLRAARVPNILAKDGSNQSMTFAMLFGSNDDVRINHDGNAEVQTKYGTVIAERGQWVVLHQDESLSVYPGTDFEEKFKEINQSKIS